MTITGRIRLALFRKNSQVFECYCREDQALASYNFIRFLSGYIN